jgi:hypothetical protein
MSRASDESEEELEKGQVCGDCGSPDALRVCYGCNEVYYCARACQKNHWKRGGHKLECAELQAKQKAVLLGKHEADPALATDGDGDGGAAVAGNGGGGGGVSDGRLAATLGGSAPVTPAVSAAQSETRQACPICLEDDKDVIPLGCGCRGDAGGAHLACKIEAAEHASRPMMVTDGPATQLKLSTWAECSICAQEYTGAMGLGMFEQLSKFVTDRGIPGDHPFKLDIDRRVASQLRRNGRLTEAEAVHRSVLRVQKLQYSRNHSPDSVLGYELSRTMVMLANTLSDLGSITQAAELYREALPLLQKHTNPEHAEVLNCEYEIAQASHATT